ncbi:metalloendopeptidase [Ascochyta clinopodiicola]|nr:metalloendopeptidase [Ascochyta clinopodiicola]
MSQAPLILLPILASLALDVSFYSANMILQLFLSMPASRKHEAEADYIGLLMAAQACYRPEAAMEFWARMEKEGQQGPPQILSTHPSNHNREEKIREWLPKAHELGEQSFGTTPNILSQFKLKWRSVDWPLLQQQPT